MVFSLLLACFLGFDLLGNEIRVEIIIVPSYPWLAYARG